MSKMDEIHKAKDCTRMIRAPMLQTLLLFAVAYMYWPLRMSVSSSVCT